MFRGAIARGLVPAAFWAALCATASAAQDAAPQFSPAGDTGVECKGGIWAGTARQVRNSLGCVLEGSAGLAGTLPGDVAGRLAAIKAHVRGASLRGLGDELARQWAEDPASSLIPRPGFTPERIVGLEFAAASPGASYRYINPTGAAGGGMAFRAYAGDYVFRGALVADLGGRKATIPIEGVYRPANTGNRIMALKLAAPAG